MFFIVRYKLFKKRMRKHLGLRRRPCLPYRRLWMQH